MLAAIEQAIAEAPGARALDAISATVWRAAGDGALADGDAHALLERIAERRATGATEKAESTPRRTSTVFPPRRPQRTPDRAEAIERRRAVAASGALPPRVARKFTGGEQAVMAVIVGQVRSTKTGDCRLPIDAIAAMAAVSRSTVKRALHTAVRIGLVRVTERPQKGRKNLPNLIEVIDRAVMGWIRRGPQRPISADRSSRADSHEYKLEKKGLPAGATETPKPDFRRSRRRRR